MSELYCVQATLNTIYIWLHTVHIPLDEPRRRLA
jgi:hypothetical protein